MTQDLLASTAPSRVRTALPAAVVAGVVVATGFVSMILDIVMYFGQTEMGGIVGTIAFYFEQFLWWSVPLALAVFLSVWLVLPISAMSGLGRTIASSAVATTLGTLAMWLSLVVQAVTVYDPEIDLYVDGSGSRFIDYLSSGTVMVVGQGWNQFAVVAAACLGVWGWQLSGELRRLRAAS